MLPLIPESSIDLEFACFEPFELLILLISISRFDCEKDKSGVVILPAMYVNRVSIRGSLEFPVVFKAICAGYASGTMPEVCEKCSSCPDQKQCISQGFCGSKKIEESVTTMHMTIAMIALSAVFCLVSYIQHRRYQSQMQAQVKGIIAEYMPLDEERSPTDTAVSDEDGEFT